MVLNVFTVREPEPEAPKKNGAYETIIVSTRGKVGLITLNRPHALNALNTELISELNRALDSLPPADEGRPVSRRSRERRNANRVYLEVEKELMGLEP